MLCCGGLVCFGFGRTICCSLVCRGRRWLVLCGIVPGSLGLLLSPLGLVLAEA